MNKKNIIFCYINYIINLRIKMEPKISTLTNKQLSKREIADPPYLIHNNNNKKKKKIQEEITSGDEISDHEFLQWPFKDTEEWEENEDSNSLKLLPTGLKLGESRFKVKDWDVVYGKRKKMREDGRSWPKDQIGEGGVFEPEWVNEYFEREKLLEKDPNYQFVKLVAGNTGKSVLAYYEEQDLNALARRQQSILLGQRASIEQIRIRHEDFKKELDALKIQLGNLRITIKETEETIENLRTFFNKFIKIQDKYIEMYLVRSFRKIVNNLVTQQVDLDDQLDTLIEIIKKSPNVFFGVPITEPVQKYQISKYFIEKYTNILLREYGKVPEEEEEGGEEEEIIILEEEEVPQTELQNYKNELKKPMTKRNFETFRTNVYNKINDPNIKPIIDKNFDEESKKISLDFRRQFVTYISYLVNQNILIPYGNHSIIVNKEEEIDDLKRYIYSTWKELLIEENFTELVVSEHLKIYREWLAKNKDLEKIRIANLNQISTYEALNNAIIDNFIRINIKNKKKEEELTKVYENGIKKLQAIIQGKPLEIIFAEPEYQHSRYFSESPEMTGIVKLIPAFESAINSAYLHVKTYVSWASSDKIDEEFLQFDKVLRSDFAKLVASYIQEIKQVDFPSQYTSTHQLGYIKIKRIDITNRMNAYYMIKEQLIDGKFKLTGIIKKKLTVGSDYIY